MNGMTHRAQGMSSEAFLRWGTAAIWGGLLLALLVLGLASWKYPGSVVYVPLGLALVGIGFIVLRHPVLNLVVLLAAFVLIADYEEGIQITEVFYGLYYLGFLAYFISKRILSRDLRLTERTEEKALLLFIVVVTLSIGCTFLFRGSLRDVVSQWSALVLLLLYFPIKELFVQDKRAATILFAIVAWVGVFAALRNLYQYYSILTSAGHLWQIARGRVVTNDNVLMIASLAMLILVIHAEQWRHRLVLLPVFFLTLGGLILTQSRGFWVAFVFGGVLLLFLVSHRHRLRLVVLASVGVTTSLLIGLIFFADTLALIVSGLMERVGSLSSARTEDVSLYNRFIESEVVLGEILKNPILGYGMGVPYRFLDVTFMGTRVDTFIHNGFLSIWYRFGILGLVLILIVWGGGIVRGLQAFRAQSAPLAVRLAGLAAAVALIVYLLPANTSNPFHLNDSLFILGVLFGMAGGAAARARRIPDDHGVSVLP